MALYLGSSEINPVETVEVIKEVPTEKDLTLMGNELRRAYCWTRQENVNGMCCLYDTYTNKFSSSFQATDIKLIENSSAIYNYTHGTSWSGYAIIDSKLYTVTSDSSGITLTQQGSNNGWESTNSTVYVRNNKIYSSYNNANNETSPIDNAVDFRLSGGNYGSAYYINNGYLYNSSKKKIDTISNVKCANLEFIDSYDLYCIANNYLYWRKPNTTTFIKVSDEIITDYRLWTGSSTGVHYFIYNKNNLVTYNAGWNASSITKGTVYTYDYPIISVLPGPYVLLENGDVYYGTTKRTQNVKGFLVNLYLFGAAKRYALTNDKKIIDLTNLSTIHTFSSNVNLMTTTQDNNIFFTSFKFLEDEIIKHKLYTTQYIDEITKAYSSNNISDTNIYNITSKTANTITVNGEVYTRDGSGDLVFDFIPEDLENHTFSDVDLLTSYLDAGIIKNLNNS